MSTPTTEDLFGSDAESKELAIRREKERMKRDRIALMDGYARAALTGILASPDVSVVSGSDRHAAIAEAAWKYARAMMKERRRIIPASDDPL